MAKIYFEEKHWELFGQHLCSALTFSWWPCLKKAEGVAMERLVYCLGRQPIMSMHLQACILGWWEEAAGAPFNTIAMTTSSTARQADASPFELLSEGYPSCQPLSPVGTGEDYYRLSLPWELACKTPMLSSNCIDLMLSDAKMHSLSCSEVSSILFWLADRITHMSQRLMLTALKSARLNGVPFGREGRKKRRRKSETEEREGKRKKIKTN